MAIDGFRIGLLLLPGREFRQTRDTSGHSRRKFFLNRRLDGGQGHDLDRVYDPRSRTESPGGTSCCPTSSGWRGHQGISCGTANCSRRWRIRRRSGSGVSNRSMLIRRSWLPGVLRGITLRHKSNVPSLNTMFILCLHCTCPSPSHRNSDASLGCRQAADQPYLPVTFLSVDGQEHLHAGRMSPFLAVCGDHGGNRARVDSRHTSRLFRRSGRRMASRQTGTVWRPMARSGA